MTTLDELGEQHAEALRQALEYIHSEFDPWLVIAAGSIVRGNPDPRSDLDLYVLHDAGYRQRLQRWFNGVPVEMFVNPESAVNEYLDDEANEGLPSTAHMIATGVVVHVTDGPRAQTLRSRASDSIATPPRRNDARLVEGRYGAATMVEDALDMRERDPANALRVLSRAVDAMLRHWYEQQGRYFPRSKDVLVELEMADAQLGDLAKAFWSEASVVDRWSAALKLADAILDTRGFFEWESDREIV